MNKTVESVAIAIDHFSRPLRSDGTRGGTDWTLKSESDRETYRGKARAAIAAHIDAMMEPSEGMHNAARDWSLHKYGKAIGSDASDGCYRAMLTAHKKEVLG